MMSWLQRSNDVASGGGQAPVDNTANTTTDTTTNTAAPNTTASQPEAPVGAGAASKPEAPAEKPVVAEGPKAPQPAPKEASKPAKPEQAEAAPVAKPKDVSSGALGAGGGQGSAANAANQAKAAAPPKKTQAATIPQTGGSFPVVFALVLITFTLLARYLRGRGYRRV
jgi:cobalamin biosynthesis Mg chelatase CobN